MISLEEHRKKWMGCRRCPLHKSRRQLCPSRGTGTKFVFLGEGPGRIEDKHGIPFKGKSGALLMEMVRASEMDEEDCCFTNLVACRACDGPYSPNRSPTYKEVDACSTRLIEFLYIVKPRHLIVLGKMTRSLLRCSAPIHTIKQMGVEVWYCDHPTYIMRIAGYCSEEYYGMVKKLNEVVHYDESEKT